MTDRSIVTTGALPQTADILNTSKFAMLGDAFLAAAAFGNSFTAPSQIVAGLACTPTSPASLNVNVGPGCIFQLDTVDATGYSDLGLDANQVYKMGIREALGTFAITPPGTAGYSQVFLVEAIMSDIDAGSTVLNYFNSANPAVPFSGPGNAGTAQYTTRTCVCTITIKPGVAAASGTQVAPAPDPGYIGLYTITVANGATQITAGNIVAVNAGFAPFVKTALPYIPAASQSGVWRFAQDTGTVNNIVVTLAPIPSQYTQGMDINVKMANAPTGAAVINVNGLGNIAIVKTGGAPLTGQEWAPGDMVPLRFDGTNFQITNSVRPILTANKTIYVNGAIGNDANDGASNATGHALATIQGAVNLAFGYSPSQYAVTIIVEPGTYGPAYTPTYAGPAISIQGVSFTTVTVSAPNNYHCFLISGPNNVSVSGVTVQTGTGSGPPCGFVALGGATLTTSNTASNSVNNAVWNANGGIINVGSHTFNNTSCNAFWSCGNGGQLSFQSGSSFTWTQAVTVTLGSVAVADGSVTVPSPGAPTMTGGGNVTGPRFYESLFGVINTSGLGVNYFPGSTAGTGNSLSGGAYA